MAKQVSELTIGIKIDGYENFDKLKSAFKGLSNAIAPASQDIVKARQAILEFGNANVETTRLVNAQIAGLKSLQTQVAINGSLYKQLGSDIDNLKAKFTSTTQEITQTTTVLDKQGSRVFGTSIDNLKKYNSNLQTTQRELAATAKAVDTTSTSVSNLGKHLKDTQNLKVDLKVDAGQVTQARGKVASTLALLRKLGEQSTTAVGAVGRTAEGITAAGITGLAAKPILGVGAGAAGTGSSFLSGLSERVTGVQDLLNRLPFGGKAGSIVSGIPEALSQQAQSLGGLETRLASLQELVNSFTTTLGTIDPKAAVATGAVITAFAFMRDRVGNEMDKVRKDIDESFTAISDDVQNLLVALQRLGDYLGKLSSAEISGQLARAQQSFASVPAGSPRSRSFASQIAGLESIQREEAAAAAAVLEEYRVRVAGTTVSIQTLGDRISYVKSAMQGLDVSTVEGSAAHAQYSSTVRDLERQLNNLATAYTHVSDFAKAATADINTANTTITQNYLNRSGVVREQTRQAAAMQELRQAITAGVQGTPLLLPAAGQTSAPGTGLQYSGQNVRLGRRPMAPDLGLVGQGTERFFGRGELGVAAIPGGPFTASRFGPEATAEQSDRARRAAISEADAQRTRAEAAQAATQRMQELRASVDKASQANNGSISSLNKLRQALSDIHRELIPTDAAFGRYSKQIEKVDRQIARTQGGRNLGGRQLAQISGAAISGGIFGGPEGFLGGVIGGAVGGVGGSFAGAAAGAQIGMMRQQLGVAAKYTAELNLVKTTLAQAVNNQEEYNQALTASRSISKDYTVDLMGTIQGYAQLITATRANNISLAETEKVYRGIIASGVAFGKSQEDIASMVRATVQILSKGKVTAEELRGQLGERLPGAVPKFAEATGRTMAQLEKDLEDGKVSIDDFKKFAIKGFIDYDEAAKKIGAGPEKAGLRLDNALKQMMESYGTFFQTVGAGFQNNLTVVINWANENEKVMKRIMYLIMKITEYQYKYLNPITAPVLGLPELPGTVERGARGLGQANPTTSNLFGDLLRKNPITGPQVLYSDLLSKGKVTASVSLNQERTNKLASIFEMMTADYESLFPKAKVPTIFGQGGSGIAPSATSSTDEDAKERKKAAQEALDTLRGVLAVEEAVFKAGQALQLSRYELNKKLTDMETQNRLAALGTIERETAQALEDRRAKTVQFAEELRALEDKQLEAARALNAAQRLAAKGGDQQAVKEAQANLNLVTTQLNDLVKAKPRFMTAADVATMNDLTASTKSRNEELQKTIRLETLRADLQQRGYSAAQVQLQLDIASAEDERRRSLTGVTQLDQIAKINAGYAEMVANLQKIYDLNQANANTFAFREGAQRYVESIGTMREATASLTEQGFKGLEDVIFQLTTTGTANFQAFAASILEQTARMIIQQIVLKTIMQALGLINPTSAAGASPVGAAAIGYGGGFTPPPNAKGNVFTANGIVPYAMGGIVTRPTLFPFAKGGAIGTGLMGEAGPEAIIPLQRGANGKLGVAGGGNTTNVVVNVDASGGTSSSSDSESANQLGRVVAAAVRTEIAKQQRPGGMLA